MRHGGRVGAVSDATLRQLCAELERRLRAGEAGSAEAVIASHPGLDKDADAALEIIYTEFVAREQLGQRPRPDEFLTRFPEWHEGLAELFQIHGAVGISAAGPAHDAGTPFPDATHWRGAHLLSSDGGRRVGNYQLLEEIGRGGMGVVYKAHQLGLNRPVALKMILTGADAGPQERARFRAEAEAAAHLHHPNIVQIYEVGEHDGRPFLSQEFVAGGSLEARLAGVPWPAAEAAGLVQTLARAMHYAHQQGVVHRDLKPANVLLQPAPESPGGGEEPPASRGTIPKIADFGLARRLSSATAGPGAATALTAAGAIIGTPAYMAPEQAAGDRGEIGPAADTYALGAILYELLTGRPPFQGVGVLETLEQVRSHDPIPPGRLVPGMARDIETICLKCLQKEPPRRYETAAALADDLGRYLDGHPVHARPTGTGEKAWKWAKRRPALALTLTTLVVLTVIGLTTVTVLWQQTVAALHTVQKERDEKEAAFASKLIALAHRDWLDNNIKAARRRLEECPPAHRGPEWHYLDRVCHACIFEWESRDSSQKITSLAWSPDARLLAANLGSTVKIWNSEAWSEDSTLPRKFGLPKLGFDVDGHLVSLDWPRFAGILGSRASKRLEVTSWDVKTGQVLGEFTPSLDISSQPVISSDGRRIAYLDLARITVMDVRQGHVLASILEPSKSIQPMALNADGSRIAWGSEHKFIRVWDVAADREVGSIGSFRGVASMVFAPDRERIAVARNESDKKAGFVELWDPRTGKIAVSLQAHADFIRCVAISPDGRRLATGSADKTVKVWDLPTGRELLTLRGHRDSVLLLSFNADGTRLASGAYDGAIRIWDVRPFEPAGMPDDRVD